MLIALSNEQKSKLIEMSSETPYSVNEILDTLSAIYEANFEDDVRAAIEHLEEVGHEG